MPISTPQWVRDAIFYSIFPDRFARSSRLDKTELNLEAWNSEPTSHGFKGGDLLGVLEHLDYLQNLGINAIYLTPIFTSPSNHHYHTFDYYNVDPLFGGNSALRELLDEMHRRGMRLVLDGVFNHASRGFYQFIHTLENGRRSPFVDWFRFNPDMLDGRKPFNPYPGNWGNDLRANSQSSLDLFGYEGWYDLPALPKFNTNTPAVREFLLDVAEYWIKFGIDGWRIDVAKEIDDDSFYQEFRQRVRTINPEAYIVGELWQESQRWLAGDQFDASMNYLLDAAIMGFFIPDLTHEIFDAGDFNSFLVPLNAEEFAARINYLLNLYDPAVNDVMLNLLDSHDTPRFITTARGDQSAYDMALLFEFTFVGTPCIYYGDEIGLQGRNDPECRRTFPWDPNLWDRHRLEETRQLIQIRREHEVFRSGAFNMLYAAEGRLAYMREGSGEKAIVAFNVSKESQEFQIQVPHRRVEKWFGEGECTSAGETLRFRIPGRRGLLIKVD
jgi:neopullulanase